MNFSLAGQQRVLEGDSPRWWHPSGLWLQGGQQKRLYMKHEAHKECQKVRGASFSPSLWSSQLLQDTGSSCLKESFHHFRQRTKPKINISASAVFRKTLLLRGQNFSLSKSLYSAWVKWVTDLELLENIGPNAQRKYKVFPWNSANSCLQKLK